MSLLPITTNRLLEQAETILVADAEHLLANLDRRLDASDARLRTLSREVADIRRGIHSPPLRD
ncbi:hypothetical protein [Corynebacterium flavescens]|uniref:hypothetical protein n=1 Tax=Corynebacterium flavescens TaxID=28028 RepID=UPI003FD4794F